jgi:hypothetical protein
MNWTRFALAVVASGVAASFTDWLFMGALFHAKYLETPELWRRPQGGKGETSAIVAATAIGLISCAALIYLCIWAGALSLTGALRLAVLAWLAAPLPLILMNSLWMKYHPLLIVSHSAGWLARFLVTAVIAAWLLG